MVIVSIPLGGMDRVRSETHTELAIQKYGVTGSGVLIAIIDRGIDWRHPDFLNANGTTRIRAMLDMSGQKGWCASGNPAPVEYSQSQINAALAGNGTIAERDAVGHGTATAGIAAGNGRASGGRLKGIAPRADLLIVKAVSEGAPAHDAVPAEPAFQACLDQALAWVDAKIDAFGEPTVGIINSGTQWGPIDGTSAVSRKIDSVFGSSRPGRIFVAPSGDEGSLNNHAGGEFSDTATNVGFAKASDAVVYPSLWYSGATPAEITISFADGASSGPVRPNQSVDVNGIAVTQYLPGMEFDPWRSTSGDRAVWMRITGHAGAGNIRIQAFQPGAGRFDVYGDIRGPDMTPIITFKDHLAVGRLTDYASTRSAITVANHVVRDTYTDVNGTSHNLAVEGHSGDLWIKSSTDPTRDRRFNLDASAPGENAFAPLAAKSYYSTRSAILPREGEGRYVRFSGTSASAPIVVGAVALMLEVNPRLTGGEVRAILRATASQDAFTGRTPNGRWGYGKLDVLRALDSVVATTAGAFTDPTIVSSSAPVKAVHVTELRARIDALRARLGLPVFVWRDSTLPAGPTTIRAEHILDLRNALADAYDRRKLAPPTYSDPDLGRSTTTTRMAHIAELRAALVEIEWRPLKE